MSALSRRSGFSTRQGLFLAVGMLVALGFSIAAAQTHTFPGDSTITHWLQRANSDRMEDSMLTASRLGGTVPLLLIALAAMVILVFRSRQMQAMALPFVAAGGALVPLLKYVIDRPRPAGDAVQVLTGTSGMSFPSGHAFMAMTLLGALIHLAPELLGRERRWAVLGLRVVLALAILAVGASRIYLGAHWFSDVLGGYVLGAVTLFAGIKLSHAWAAWRSRRTAQSPALPS